MFKHFIFVTTLLLSFVNNIHTNNPPEYIQLCKPNCPHRVMVYYNSEQKKIYMPTTNNGVETIIVYTSYAFKKGNMELFRQRSTSELPENIHNQYQCFVAPTVCNTKKQRS